MSIDYKKYLPTNMKLITRWQEFIEVFQDITNDLRTEKIDPLINQTNFQLMTKEDFSNFAKNVGYEISSFDGYTDTLQYFQRQGITIIPRLVNRTTRPAYWHNFYIFHMIGDIYPLYTSQNYLMPAWNWWTFDENDRIIDILDSDAENLAYKSYFLLDTHITQLDNSQTWDMYSSVYETPQLSGLVATTLDEDIIGGNLLLLDQESYINDIVRKLLITYKLNRIENVNEFLSEESLHAFYNDTQKIKRITEKLFYEPFIDINYKINNSLQQTEYKTFDETETAYQKTMLMPGKSLSDVITVELGTGSHTTINASITGVQILSENVTDIIYDDTILSYPIIRRNLKDDTITSKFTEFALKDSGGDVILYSTFPEINYYSLMFGNFRFNFLIV